LPALSVKIFEGQYRAASTLVADVPDCLDQFFARAMAREPAQRFSSMRELRDGLAEVNDLSAQRVAHTLPSANPTIDHTSNQAAGSHSQPEPMPPPPKAAKAQPNGYRQTPHRAGISLLIALPVAGVCAFLLVRQADNQAPAMGEPGSPTQPPAASARHDPTPPPPSLGQAASSAPLGSSELVRPVPAVTRSTGVGETVAPKLPPAVAPSHSSRSRAASDGLSERNPFAD
jgi:serine/threonine-protein kinase